MTQNWAQNIWFYLICFCDIDNFNISSLGLFVEKCDLAPIVALFVLVAFESANTLYKPTRLDKFNKFVIYRYIVIALCCFMPPVIWEPRKKEIHFWRCHGCESWVLLHFQVGVSLYCFGTPTNNVCMWCINLIGLTIVSSPHKALIHHLVHICFQALLQTYESWVFENATLWNLQTYHHDKFAYFLYWHETIAKGSNANNTYKLNIQVVN